MSEAAVVRGQTLDDVSTWELYGRFVEIAGQHAGRIAVVLQEAAWTYLELLRAVEECASGLREAGIRRGHRIAIVADPGFDLVVGILASVACQAVYVPLDKRAPTQRLKEMLDDAEPHLIMVDTESPELGADIHQASVSALRRREPVKALLPDATECGNPLYIIYTSGSTGTAKGVLLGQHSVKAMLAAAGRAMDLRSSDVWTLFHSAAFDFSVWEMWGAFLTGAKLVVVREEVRSDPIAFHALIEKDEVTVLSLTPSGYTNFQKAHARLGWPPLSLRYMVFGGEALAPSRMKAWMDHHGDETTQLLNMYGLTEGAVHATVTRIRAADEACDSYPIGRALGHLDVVVVGDDLNEVDANEVGEIYVSGDGVALGYWKRPALTAERFVPRLHTSTGERFYRTGDFGKRDEQGNLWYMGRRDRQYKVRGHRVELGDLEAALRRCSQVLDALAYADEVADGLAIGALVVLDADADGNADVSRDIRKELALLVPAYLIPARVDIVAELPKSLTGKVNLSAYLTEPESPRKDQSLSAVEARVLQIVGEILRIKEARLSDGFIEIGGHSLAAMEFVSAVEIQFGVEIPMENFFGEVTLKELADYIEQHREGDRR